MAKKYISLAEAAGILNISEDELKQFRSKGDIRGFADRGNWKFRQEDVEEFGRSRQVDSGADLPLLDDPDGDVLSDDDAIAEQPTIIRKSGDNVLGDSALELEGPAPDSGVRLVLDEGLTERTAGSDPPGESDLAQEGSSEGSSADVPLLADSDSDVALVDSDSDVRLVDSDSDIQLADSDSDVQLSDSDSDVQLADDSSTNPQLHETEGMIELPASDSDVRLTPASDGDDGSEIMLTGQDSDSDVRLLGETATTTAGPGSDSDVRLIKPDSDSDVRLLVSDSDSDVRLLAGDSPQPGSDSDVSVAGATQDAIQLPDEYDEGESVLDIDDDSGLALAADSSIALSSDSGITLETSADSGISLDAAVDSGISLDAADDSGIALDIDTDSDISLAMDDFDDESLTLDTDSGILLDAGDSGISLDAGGDSGISLQEADSGISLDAGVDSDISLDADGLEATAPAMQIPGGDGVDGSTADTLIQMPSFGEDDDDDESDFELGALEGESSSDTSVLLFDDEDDADDRAATLIKKSSDDDDETFDLDADEAFDEEFEDDEDDLLGEDDEIEDFDEDDFDDEEFMADDDDFDESFSTDESPPEFLSQSGSQGAGMVMMAEQDWGGLTFAAVLVASIAMLVCGGVMFDLVRYIWQSGDPGVVAGPMIDMVGIK